VRAWSLEVRTSGRPPTMNHHRRLHPMQRARVDLLWRDAGHRAAHRALLPRGLHRVHVTATPHYQTGRSLPDVQAVAPAVKAAIDGLVDWGLIPDDTATHVHRITHEAPIVDGWDGLVLVIEEVPA
jgi:hypothetical protein